jgi:hypothetical protein
MNTIGATHESSLRVSAATLARVVFKHPKDSEMMLVLERKATLCGADVEVKSQPFGGAIRIKNISKLRGLIGKFRFDSERSRDEKDFRIFIRSSSWSEVRDLCIDQFNSGDDLILETDPVRELTEEFDDALRINLKPDQYSCKPVATVVENDPTPTDNIHTKGTPTARIYHIFEATILDSSLIDIMLANSELISDKKLCDLAIKDARIGGKGRANAILAVPLKHIYSVYSAMSPAERNTSILFKQNRLSETVTAVLDNMLASKYQRL